MSASWINCRQNISFRYPKSTDFLVALPIKQLGLISAWCSLWASRLICKLIRSNLKAISCPSGTLQLIASRCWNLVSATLGCLTPLWSQTMLENLCSLSSQTRTGPLHGIHLFHTGILWSPQDEDTGSSNLGHLLKDLGHRELPHANLAVPLALWNATSGTSSSSP